MKANYNEILSHLEHFEEFYGNSLRGFWCKERYIVMSYNTPIAVAHYGYCTIATRKYSCTTSRGQNLIRRAWSTFIENGRSKDVEELENYMSTF